MKKLWAVLFLAGLAAGCRPPGAKAEFDAGPMLVGNENLAVVKRDTISAGPRLAGSLEARLQANVRAEAGGDVTALFVDIGQVVKKGDLLARIEANAIRDQAQSAESAVRSAESDLAVAKRQLERTQRLVEAGAVAARDLEVAQANAASAQARLDNARAMQAGAQKQLSGTTARSPMDGVVSRREVNAGDVVAPGAPLFTIIDPSSMRFEAAIPSQQIGAVQVGMPVFFEVRGYPNTFEGKLERIAPAADPATGQIPVLVSIPNVEGKLIAGLFAEGRVAIESRDALVVPDSAVEQAGGSATVLRVKDGRAEQVKVQTGVRDEATERVEIVSGLAEGDLLLAGAARGIMPGTLVRLPNQKSAQN